MKKRYCPKCEAETETYTCGDCMICDTPTVEQHKTKKVPSLRAIRAAVREYENMLLGSRHNVAAW